MAHSPPPIEDRVNPDPTLGFPVKKRLLPTLLTFQSWYPSIIDVIELIHFKSDSQFSDIQGVEIYSFCFKRKILNMSYM